MIQPKINKKIQIKIKIKTKTRNQDLIVDYNSKKDE